MKIHGLYIFIIFFQILPIRGQIALDARIKQLDEYYQQMTDEWDVPGMSVAIVKDGKIIFNGNYGTKHVGSNHKPDENTLYAIASNSKAFTTAIIGMLVEEGKLDWDDKVKKYLPYFEVYDPWVSNQVTVRDLLCHRVGLGTFSGDIIWYKSDLTSEEIIKRIKHLPPAFDFRAGYGYSNLMYITAGELIKEITGKSWSENVKERILHPLSMNRTITTPEHLVMRGNYATPHAREDEKNIPIAWENWEEVGATGGIISSTSDIAKWMIFNLNHGVWNADTLFSVQTRNMVWTPHNNYLVDHTSYNDFNTHFRGYGLGWGLSDAYGNLVVQHTGGYDGMISAVTLIPDHDIGIVVLTNGMKSPIRPATFYAMELLLEKEPQDWSARYLEAMNKREREDPRITNIKENRVPDTQPSLTLDNYAGTFVSDIYGEITITYENNALRMLFEHTPSLSAALEHWHYDVWEIKWDETHAWFNFGTVKFDLDNNLKVKGLTFDVPNDDIFFEELKPYKKMN